jgi:hypothetical protein
MSNNTQLPAEVVLRIQKEAEVFANKTFLGKTFRTPHEIRYRHYIEIATEYATKLHQEQQEKATLKAKGEKLALSLRRCALSMNVHPDYEPNSEFFDRVGSAHEALAEWKGEKEPAREISVFVPCMENDPRCCGGYTSNDGQSLCYVRETTVPVIEQGGVWVKASARLPEKDGLYCFKQEHGGYMGAYVATDHNGTRWVRDAAGFTITNWKYLEWLDESAGLKEVPEWITWLTDHSHTYPNLSDLNEAEKKTLVDTLFQSSGMQFLKLFYAIGLENFMETGIINDSTGDLFRLRFELMQKGHKTCSVNHNPLKQ